MKKKLMGKLCEKFRQPKWRHGRLSALLMAGFAVICVLGVVAVETLEDAYGWKQDLSFNAYATTGEQTRAALDRLEYDVDLYLLYQSGEVYERVWQVLERYAALSERVHIHLTDIAQNPGVLTAYQGDVDHVVEADTLIVNCPDTGRYQLLNDSDFMITGYNIETGEYEVESLAYEKSITEAITYVTREDIPTLGVLQGHGEFTMDNLDALISFLRSNSYDTVEVNLLSGDTLDDVDTLLIAGPQNDLTNAELDMIAAYAQNGGCLFVLRDYTDPLDSMPNYLALLNSYGVTPIPGVVVAGADDVGSYWQEQIYLMPYMEELDMTAQLIDDGMDVLLMPAACAFQVAEETETSLTAVTVLKTGPNAYVRNVSDGNASIDQQEGDISGELTVATFSHRMHANGNVSRLFAVGCSALFTEEYIYQATYAEEFVLMILGQLMPGMSVSLDIMTAAAFRPSLTAGSQAVGVALVVATPLLVIMAALCVLLPRRNR